LEGFAIRKILDQIWQQLRILISEGAKDTFVEALFLYSIFTSRASGEDVG